MSLRERAILHAHAPAGARAAIACLIILLVCAPATVAYVQQETRPSPPPSPTHTASPAPSARPSPTQRSAVENFKDVAAGLQSIATTAGIILAGIWAYMLFLKKRQRYPRAKVTHSIMSSPINRDKTLLKVTVSVSNTGEVLLKLTGGYVNVYSLKPWPPEFIEKVSKGKDPVKEPYTEVDWPRIGNRKLNVEKGPHEIEPGETDENYFDFIIGADVETVQVYSYLEDKTARYRLRREGWRPRLREDRNIGWNNSTIYDVKSSSTIDPHLDLGVA